MANYESSILDPVNGSDCIIEDDDDDGGNDCSAQNIVSYHAHIRSWAVMSYWTQDSEIMKIEDRQTENRSICCDRSYSNKLPDWKGCAWYCIGGQAGTQLNEKELWVRGSWGAHYGGYLSWGLPTVQEGGISRKVYFDHGVGNNKIKEINIKVVNCNSKYFIFYNWQTFITENRKWNIDLH